MKKLIFLALTAVLLTGCSSRNTDNDNGRSNDNAAVTQEADESNSSMDNNGSLTGEDDAQTGDAQTPADEAKPPSQEEAQQDFANIEIEISECTLYIRSGSAFDITCHGSRDADYRISDNTLYLNNNGSSSVAITLPEDKSYRALEIESKNSHVYVYTLTTDTLKLEAEQGEIFLDGITVSDSSILEAEEASVFLFGNPGSVLTAECSKGHMGIMVPFAQEEGNYEIDASNSDIRLGTRNYHGSSKHETIDNGGSYTIQLTAVRGDISMEFEQTEADRDAEQEHKNK